MRVGGSPWGGIAHLFPAITGIDEVIPHLMRDLFSDLCRRLGSRPRIQCGGEDQLELVFELLRQILDVFRRPVFDIHTQMQPHA